MSIKVLEELIKQIMTQGGPHISFAWQGGEPTLMGLPFFKKAVEFQIQYSVNKTVSNGLQTNGLLINKEWAKFLKEYNFLVGLSLDGPEHIHNRYRITKGQKGSWKDVHSTAKMLISERVETNALTVVNDYSANFSEEIYNFHKGLGLNFMQFIPCVETDPTNPLQAAPYSVSEGKYGEFLIKIFDLWFADIKNGVATTSVRYFDSLFHKYVNLIPPDCTLEKECGVYLVVEHNGNVYPCDFFVENEWKLGNIMNAGINDMFNSTKQKEFSKMKAKMPKECWSCTWVSKCYGGCTKDRLRDPEDDGSNHFCFSYKMFFEHADEKFKQLARQWRTNNGIKV